MRKEIYYRRSAAQEAAVKFASDNGIDGRDLWVGTGTADSSSMFDYEDDEMIQHGAWSGEVEAYIVSDEQWNKVGVFAYFEREL